MHSNNVEGQRIALVTGCSSGIGRATAIALHADGHLVYASARRPESIADLATMGLRTVALDVTDEGSMHRAVRQIEAEAGPIDILVNNAGYGLSGTIEETSSTAIREQFETNVFGPTRLTQMVMPGMRRNRSGVIVTLSSIFGRYAVPGAGYYHATKHAVEAIADALRHEVRPFGINVVLVEPGPVLSSFADRYVAGMAPTRATSPYREFLETAAEYYSAVYTRSRPTLAGIFASSSDDVADTISRAVASPSPRPRYAVGLIAHTTLMLRRVLSDKLFDALVVRRRFPAPQQSAEMKSLDKLLKEIA